MHRREQEVIAQAQSQVQDRRRRRRGSQNLRWAAAWWVLVLAVFFFFPWPLGEKAMLAAHGLCAQHPGHMLIFAGHAMPLCARDSGVYTGALLGMLYLLVRRRWLAVKRPPRWFWFVFWAVVALFVVDVANSTGDDWFGLAAYTPNNLLRLASGLSLGLLFSVPLLWAINLSFARRDKERPIFSGWTDFAALGALGVAVGLAMAGGWLPLYLPMSALAMVGMVGMLVVANAMALLMLVPGKQVLDGLWETAGAVLVGSVATVAEMALLAWMRYRFF